MLINLEGERPENISPEVWEKLKETIDNIYKITNELYGSEKENEKQ